MRILLTLLSATLFVVNAASADDPKDLSNLRDSWTRARNQATSPIDKKYSDALGMMKLKFKKEGNLEAALAVDTEIKKLSEAAPTSLTTPLATAGNVTRKKRDSIEKAVWAKWNMPNGAYGQFQEGSIWSLEGIKSKYEIEKSGEILITDEAKKTARLKMSDDQNTLIGTWFDGTIIELKRRPQ